MSQGAQRGPNFTNLLNKLSARAWHGGSAGLSLSSPRNSQRRGLQSSEWDWGSETGWKDTTMGSTVGHWNLTRLPPQGPQGHRVELREGGRRGMCAPAPRLWVGGCS